MATLREADEEGLALAGQWIREGRLVAFPTETVYGLGGNAMSEAALRLIFTAKGRPLTDPLIVHVHSLDQALGLLDFEEAGEGGGGGAAREAFIALAKAFWPGPLTLIAKANLSLLPSVVTAGTGFVGVRLPAHPTAQALIRAANVPIAAPSANRFGHVSPTRAQHVLDDLGHRTDLMVLLTNTTDSSGQGGGGELSSSSSPGGSGGCEIGIESTVVKIITTALPPPPSHQQQQGGGGGGELVVFRRGAVTEAQLQEALASAAAADGGDGGGGGGGGSALSSFSIRVLNRADKEEVAQEAPGQLITHYAPDVPTFLVRGTLLLASNNTNNKTTPTPTAATTPTSTVAAPGVVMNSGGGGGVDKEEDNKSSSPWQLPSGVVVIDFADHLHALRGGSSSNDDGGGCGGCCLAYRSLSRSGDVREAGRTLFETLRWAEAVPGVRVILLAEVVGGATTSDGGDDDGGFGAGVQDRMTRAASGRVLTIGPDGALPSIPPLTPPH